MGQQVINNIPGLSYTPAINGALPKIVFNSFNAHVYRLPGNITIPGTPSAASGNKWSFFLVIPRKAFMFRHGTKIFKKLRRFIKTQAQNYMLGPWSPKAIERNSQALADKWLYPQDENGDPDKSKGMIVPHVIAGDDEFIVPNVDYDPSDQDCIDDVDAVEGDLF